MNTDSSKRPGKGCSGDCLVQRKAPAAPEQLPYSKHCKVTWSRENKQTRYYNRV